MLNEEWSSLVCRRAQEFKASVATASEGQFLRVLHRGFSFLGYFSGFESVFSGMCSSSCLRMLRSSSRDVVHLQAMPFIVDWFHHSLGVVFVICLVLVSSFTWYRFHHSFATSSSTRQVTSLSTRQVTHLQDKLLLTYETSHSISAEGPSYAFLGQEQVNASRFHPDGFQYCSFRFFQLHGAHGFSFSFQPSITSRSRVIRSNSAYAAQVPSNEL